MSVQLVHGSRFNPETRKGEPVNAVEDVFGEGVKLKSITVEITDEPVTWGVVDKVFACRFTEEMQLIAGRSIFRSKSAAEWAN